MPTNKQWMQSIPERTVQWRMDQAMLFQYRFLIVSQLLSHHEKLHYTLHLLFLVSCGLHMLKSQMRFNCLHREILKGSKCQAFSPFVVETLWRWCGASLSSSSPCCVPWSFCPRNSTSADCFYVSEVFNHRLFTDAKLGRSSTFNRVFFHLVICQIK